VHVGTVSHLFLESAAVLAGVHKTPHAAPADWAALASSAAAALATYVPQSAVPGARGSGSSGAPADPLVDAWLHVMAATGGGGHASGDEAQGAAGISRAAATFRVALDKVAGSRLEADAWMARRMLSAAAGPLEERFGERAGVVLQASEPPNGPFHSWDEHPVHGWLIWDQTSFFRHQLGQPVSCCLPCAVDRQPSSALGEQKCRAAAYACSKSTELLFLPAGPCVQWAIAATNRFICCVQHAIYAYLCVCWRIPKARCCFCLHFNSNLQVQVSHC
jgi:hypothetical protein